MQFSIIQEDLFQSLANLVRFTTTKAQLPILNNLCLTASNNQLRISATNLEISLTQFIPATVQIEGSITVPAKELSEFVSYLPAGKIDFSLDPQNLLQLQGTNSSATFTTQSSADFPNLFQTASDLTSLELSTSDLKNDLDQIIFASAQDDNRPVLTSVLTILEPTQITLVATDGYRLSKITRSQKISITSELRLLIPAQALQEASKFFKLHPTVTLQVSKESSQVTFLFPDLTQLSARLLQGDYPEYSRILPQNSTTTALLDREEFNQALKAASVFARVSANVIRIKFGTGSLQVSANAPQIGKNQIQVEAKLTGEPLEIAFNVKYVLDFLAHTSSPSITLSCNQPLTPALFQDPKASNFLHVIMPVRLQD